MHAHAAGKDESCLTPLPPARAANDSHTYLSTILDGIGEGFYAVDGEWRITRFNSEAARHFGRSPADVIGRVLWDVFPGARDTGLGQLFLDTMAKREPVKAETESVVFAGRWLAYRLFPLEDGLGVVFRDITDRKRAEEQRDLLVGELFHRVNNTLATVQAIAAQTFRDKKEKAVFASRLRALSAAHSSLAKESWQSTPLTALVWSAVRPHTGPSEDRFTVHGPDMRIQPHSAVALSMAIHELCTNAAKYGALSREGGRISIEWRIDGSFTFRWTESGGPAVAPPGRRGFGSVMIERALAAQGGQAQVDYRPEGVVCTINAPIENVRE